MLKMRKVVVLFLTMLMVTSLCACEPKKSGKEPGKQGIEPSSGSETSGAEKKFRIGVYQFMAGTAIGSEMDVAFEVAMNEYGNKINGEPIEIIKYDTLNNPTEAVNGVQYLIGQNVDAVIGSFQSPDVVAAYPYLEKAKIVNVFMGTSGSVVTKDQVYSFRGAFNGDYSAPAFVQLAKKLGYTNVGIFYGQDESSVSNYNVIKKEMEDGGIKVIAVETGSGADTDYSSQCMKLVDKDPEFIYVVCTGAGVNFIKQLREFGYNGIIMNKDEWMTSHVSTVGEENSNYIAGCVAYTTYKDLETAEKNGATAKQLDFLRKYYAIAGQMPQAGITYRCYDSMLILLEAAKRAGTNHDSDAIAKTILTINDLEGCMGTIDYTRGDREPCHSFMNIIYDNGASKLFEGWFDGDGYRNFLNNTGRKK